MEAALIAAVASLVVAALSIFAPRLSAKHQRELALMEAELAAKYPDGSKTGERLNYVIRTRVIRWEMAADRLYGASQLGGLAFALAFGCLAVYLALGVAVDPAVGAEEVRRTLNTLRPAFMVGFIVLTLMCLILWVGGTIASVVTSVRKLSAARATPKDTVSPDTAKTPPVSSTEDSETTSSTGDG